MVQLRRGLPAQARPGAPRARQPTPPAPTAPAPPVASLGTTAAARYIAAVTGPKHRGEAGAPPRAQVARPSTSAGVRGSAAASS